MIKNYYIIFENNRIKNAFIPKTVILEGKSINNLNNIIITIQESIFNNKIYIIHTEEKNKHCNIIYKNINFHIKSNTTINIINIYLKNNNYNTLFCTRYTHILGQKSTLRTVTINNNYTDIKNYISTQNTLESNTTLEMFYITLPSDTFNLHIHTHLGTDTKLHIYTILKTIEKQKSIVNIKTSHNDKNSISTNTLKAITHKNTNLNIKTAIVIKENADKVIANTCCKALTLSNDSEITVKPFLKILNNDVVCTHGASIGLIDRNMLQYMQSRGIKIEKAKLLIANGFIKDILNKISDMKVKTYTNTIN